jgi:hypothetical protein
MSNEASRTSIEFAAQEARKAAEKGVVQSRETFEKFNTAAKGAFRSIDASALIVTKGLSEFNAKAFEAFQANSALTFEFLRALSGTKTVSDALSLAPAHANKQFQALKDQTKDLSALAQKIAQESVAPLQDVVDKDFAAVGLIYFLGADRLGADQFWPCSKTYFSG